MLRAARCPCSSMMPAWRWASSRLELIRIMALRATSVVSGLETSWRHPRGVGPASSSVARDESPLLGGLLRAEIADLGLEGLRRRVPACPWALLTILQMRRLDSRCLPVRG